MKLNSLKAIAFTHKTVGVSELPRFYIPEEEQYTRLETIKKGCGLSELFYLSTCNRCEFFFVSGAEQNHSVLTTFFRLFNSNWDKEQLAFAIQNASILEGEEALLHLFRVASSLDSLVVGEREIITQVRNAYERCRSFGLTGDLLRLAVKKTIEAAKEIYSETHIARNPVSVVSLAYRKLKELNCALNARFLLVGAGATNSNMAKYLKKHGFSNFVVFNRTLSRAAKLAEELNGEAFSLKELKNYARGFDVIVTCTGAPEAVITKEIYHNLLQGDSSRKIVIDLAVPNDLDEELLKQYDINLIAINNLQGIASENLKGREKELIRCDAILKKYADAFRNLLREREIELAMTAVPEKVRAIRDAAVNTVFARDIDKLDEPSRQVLEKILSYVEKKYISGPMKMAKEIILEKSGTK